ncbi:hypothetical protein GCM10010129_21340 [Streptomyces fumigatiscleroticus]|nr:hypothetical protein GCM10010129_21340 [Streptomyces fumigatiscleroticus]
MRVRQNCDLHEPHGGYHRKAGWLADGSHMARVRSDPRTLRARPGGPAGKTAKGRPGACPSPDNALTEGKVLLRSAGVRTGATPKRSGPRPT